jgi:type III secretion protein R
MISDPASLIILLFVLSILPVIFVMTTSFIKISVVCILARESLGVQQVPPNVVVYGLALILSFYVMGPVYNSTYLAINQDISNGKTLTTQNVISDFGKSEKQIKQFLYKHSTVNEQEFFYKSLQQFWSKEMLSQVKRDDYIILIPAFMISELTEAFKMGFLIYLPAVIIDIVVSNILMAMGMMMMSPVTISLPIKLLLFIAIDGWSRLIHVLLASY